MAFAQNVLSLESKTMPLPPPSTVDVRLQTLAAAHHQWREGEFLQATAYAQMVFNWFPNDPQTWKCLVLILLAQGRWANAGIALTQALSLAPTDPALQLWGQALSCVDVHGMKNHDAWLRSLADAMLVEAHPQDAEDVAWIAVRLGVASPWVVVCRAKALGLQKRVAEGKVLLQNALNDEAASPMHWLALAQLDLDAQHVGEAIAVLREGLTHFPDDLELKLALSSALLFAGDVAGADVIAFSVGTASADEPELLLQRGMVRMRQRDLLTAQTLFRDALTAWLDAGEPSRIRTLPATGFDSERIERAMWETLMHLHDDGIQAFPTSGTLLGLTRDGGLLPFDKDWDFGVPWEQMPAAVNCLL